MVRASVIHHHVTMPAPRYSLRRKRRQSDRTVAAALSPLTWFWGGSNIGPNTDLVLNILGSSLRIDETRIAEITLWGFWLTTLTWEHRPVELVAASPNPQGTTMELRVSGESLVAWDGACLVVPGDWSAIQSLGGARMGAPINTAQNSLVTTPLLTAMWTAPLPIP